jgi:hypothetical protein
MRGKIKRYINAATKKKNNKPNMKLDSISTALSFAIYENIDSLLVSFTFAAQN